MEPITTAIGIAGLALKAIDVAKPEPPRAVEKTSTIIIVDCSQSGKKNHGQRFLTPKGRSLVEIAKRNHARQIVKLREDDDPALYRLFERPHKPKGLCPTESAAWSRLNG